MPTKTPKKRAPASSTTKARSSKVKLAPKPPKKRAPAPSTEKAKSSKDKLARKTPQPRTGPGAKAKAGPPRKQGSAGTSPKPTLTFVELGASLEIGEARCTACRHAVWSDAMGFSECEHTVLIWTTNSDFGGYCDSRLLQAARKQISSDDDDDDGEGGEFGDMMEEGYWLHEHGDEVADLAPAVLKKSVVVYAVRAHDDTFIAMVDAELVPASD